MKQCKFVSTNLRETSEKIKMKITSQFNLSKETFEIECNIA